MSALQVVLLLVPAGERSLAKDQEGELALSVLCSMGLPTLAVLAVGRDAGTGLKERSSDKKRAAAALASQARAAAVTGQRGRLAEG
jgi:hypothetical protein